MTEYFEVDAEKDLKSMDTFLEDWKYYEFLKNLALDNKSIVGYRDHKYTVQKNTEIDLGMEKYKNIHYNIELPIENEQYLSNKLIVFFMPADRMISTQAKLRMFGNSPWESLASSIAKNTYILRIADSNLISGSYYQNTINFPNYETSIQQLIQNTAYKYNISSGNIVMYGNSRGGTGALYHGLLGNYKVVAIDPVIDRRAWVEVKDVQHMFDLVDYNFSPKINRLLEETTLSPDKIKVLCSDTAFITYPFVKQLNLSKINLLNLNLTIPHVVDPFTSHAALIGKTVPLQLSLINQFLYEEDISIEKSLILFNVDDWDVLLPWTSPYFTMHFKDYGIEVIRNSKLLGKDNIWLNFMIKSRMIFNKKYTIEIITDESTLSLENSLFIHSENKYKNIDLKRTNENGEVVWKSKFTADYSFEFLGLNAEAVARNNSIIIRSIKIFCEDR